MRRGGAGDLPVVDGASSGESARVTSSNEETACSTIAARKAGSSTVRSSDCSSTNSPSLLCRTTSRMVSARAASPTALSRRRSDSVPSMTGEDAAATNRTEMSTPCRGAARSNGPCGRQRDWPGDAGSRGPWRPRRRSRRTRLALDDAGSHDSLLRVSERTDRPLSAGRRRAQAARWTAPFGFLVAPRVRQERRYMSTARTRRDSVAPTAGRACRRCSRRTSRRPAA